MALFIVVTLSLGCTNFDVILLICTAFHVMILFVLSINCTVFALNFVTILMMA